MAAIAWGSFGSTTKADNQPSVQQQLDELKRGQERILQELEALRSAIQQAPARNEMQARPAGPAVLNVHGEPFKGATNATVAIVEYSDFDCSHCAQFATQTFPEIDRKYIATGKIKYFFRDLPEGGNAESLLKARFARCAGEQGKFWQAHDYLFAAKPNLTADEVPKQAELIGLDSAALADCMKNEKYAIMIQRSATGATRMGFHGTPTFVVGQLTDQGDILRVKQVLLGIESAESFEKLIDDLLGFSQSKNPADGSK